MKKYLFVIECEVVKDSFEEGETDIVNYWGWEATLTQLTEDETLESILERLVIQEFYYNKFNIEHAQVDTEKTNRFCYSIQLFDPNDITTNNLSETQIEQWKADRLELYMANLDITVFESVPTDLSKIEKINLF